MGVFVTELLPNEGSNLNKWGIKLKVSLPGMSARIFLQINIETALQFNIFILVDFIERIWLTPLNRAWLSDLWQSGLGIREEFSAQTEQNYKIRLE